ncbi:recombinase family protein [Microbacterium testaceum]|uniref:Resolvase/invertase-type recombinase catalytic domain-containing protein n=1 Tax=Microbacterium testaceum TaxID=2033 RepID=A0A2T7WBQ7_MICTE|nr:recombinase family protein [Microbacterium testaceum]PVE67918.1 hypothetical protein DC432_12220 [Microbacterium testaceum]
MKVVAYLRVSTDQQDTSMSAQRDLIERWAAYREHDIVAWLSDPDVSGGTGLADREGGREVLRMLSAKEAQGVVVTKLDRLSRDVADFATVLKQFRKKNWSVATLDLDIDTATTNGEMIAHVLMALAQWERRQIGDRTRAALAELKRQGKPYGGRPSKTDLRGEVVNYITMRRDEGAGLSQIARELNEAGHLTSLGNRFYPSTVAKLVERVSALVS